MKLTLLLIIGLNLSSFCGVKAQTVNIEVRNMPFKSVTSIIQKQTGYSFTINERLLRLSKPVTVTVSNLDLEDALKLIFQGQPFDYQIKGKIIVVVPKNEPENGDDGNQLQPIGGKVTDSLGNPLPGVTVKIIGTNIVTSTDSKGMYEFRGAPLGTVLSFHLLGYEPYEVFIDRPVINVVLKLLYSMLDGVQVNAGYYTVSERERTG